MNPRRSFFRSVLGLGAGVAAVTGAAKAQQIRSGPTTTQPVLTPDIADLSFTMDNGVKVFHLVAEPVKQVIIPGRTFDLWGFNGSAPGPTIQANEGDRVRIVFENHLPEPTGIHWHGLELPIEMDGVPGIGQKPVMPGERFVYELPLNQNGTFFYHPHGPGSRFSRFCRLRLAHNRHSSWRRGACDRHGDQDFGHIRHGQDNDRKDR